MSFWNSIALYKNKKKTHTHICLLAAYSRDVIKQLKLSSKEPNLKNSSSRDAVKESLL